MSRPPRARLRVLEAARDLVLREGVRSLTLESLAQGSGVTRGGILYHWPSRQALIQGLVAHDLEGWDRRCREAAEPGGRGAGHIRCSLDPRDGVGTLAASLLPEARQDPVAWDCVKRHDEHRFRDWAWDDTDVARYVLLLAAEGAFWRRLHGLAPDVPDLGTRTRRKIEGWLAALDHGRGEATESGRSVTHEGDGGPAADEEPASDRFAQITWRSRPPAIATRPAASFPEN